MFEINRLKEISSFFAVFGTLSSFLLGTFFLEYGLTEDNNFLIVLGMFLLIIFSVGFILLSKRRDIRQ